MDKDILEGPSLVNEHYKEQRLNHDKLVVYKSSENLKQPVIVKKDGLSAKKIMAGILLIAGIAGAVYAINEINDQAAERMGYEPGTIMSVDGDGGGYAHYTDENTGLKK